MCGTPRFYGAKMIGITVEFMRTNPPKIIHKEFNNRKGMENFITRLDGSNFVVSSEDGTLGLWVGSKYEKEETVEKK